MNPIQIESENLLNLFMRSFGTYLIYISVVFRLSDWLRYVQRLFPHIINIYYVGLAWFACVCMWHEYTVQQKP